MPAGDLCTVAEIRALRQIPTVDVESDQVIGDLITRWSKTITSRYRREFAPPASAAQRKVEFDACDTLIDLAPYDARTVTAVTLDAGLDTAQVLASGDWRLELYDSLHGVWCAIRLDPTAVNYTDTWPRRTLTATGDWGFAAIPEYVREACIEAVAMTLTDKVEAFAGPLQPNSLGVGVNDAVALPPGIRGLLAPCRR